MPNTNSNRFKLQQYIEAEIGCQSPANIGSYKVKFEAFQVVDDNKGELLNALKDDACDIFHKACLTYIEAVCAISGGYQSWAIVKLYYATFYFLRCMFAAHGVGIAKCNGIYTLNLAEGERPTKRDGQKYKGQDVRGDHKTTLFTFEKHFEHNSLLLTNSINSKSVLEWMMSMREDINYRNAKFSEPEFSHFEASLQHEGKVLEWINKYLNDEVGTYLFQEDHCCLAVPSYLLKSVKSEFDQRLGLKAPLSSEQFQNIHRLMVRSGLRPNHSFLSLFKD